MLEEIKRNLEQFLKAGSIDKLTADEVIRITMDKIDKSDLEPHEIAQSIYNEFTADLNFYVETIIRGQQ
jgi:hypothetical protein